MTLPAFHENRKTLITPQTTVVKAVKVKQKYMESFLHSSGHIWYPSRGPGEECEGSAGN